MQLDSIELFNDYIYLGLSNLGGCKWDGCIRRVSLSKTDDQVEVPTSSGVTMVRKLHGSNDTYILSCHDNGCINVYNSDLNLVQHREAHDHIVSGIAIGRGICLLNV